MLLEEVRQEREAKAATQSQINSSIVTDDGCRTRALAATCFTCWLLPRLACVATLPAAADGYVPVALAVAGAFQINKFW